VLLVLPIGLFCGFYVAVSELPGWIQWMAWLDPLFYTLGLFLEEEFKFCGEPKGYDKELLGCVAGLESVIQQDFIIANEFELTLASTGVYKGLDGLAEYACLVSTDAAGENKLVYDACYLKDHFGLIVNSVSPGYCDITAGAIIAGVWNEPYVSNKDKGMEAVFGYRYNFALGSGSTPVRVDKVHVFWVNPFVNTYVPFDQEMTSDVVCNILKNVCSEEYFAPFQNHSECVDAMNTLPIGQWDANSHWNYKGNSTGCRAVHSFMASQNPVGHCPHLSWNQQIDPSGNYKCDDLVLDELYYNWTTDELNLFARLAAEINMFEPAQARYYPVNQQGRQCVEDPGASLVQFALTNLDEFEDLNVQCYQYLQDLGATPDMKATFWLSLLALIFGLRVVGALLMSRNAKFNG